MEYHIFLEILFYITVILWDQDIVIFHAGILCCTLTYSIFTCVLLLHACFAFRGIW